MTNRPLAALIGLAAALTGCVDDDSSVPRADAAPTSSRQVLGDPHDPTPPQCDDEQLAGDWNVTIDGLGTSTWTLTPAGDGTFDTTERGLGNSTGNIVHTTHILGQQLPTPLLTGAWATTDSEGTLTWILDQTCDSGTGDVTFTTHHRRPANDTYVVTIHRTT